MRNLKARPTEYRGVVYRSKSEALLARRMEISDLINGFVYEPDFPSELWRPDFMYWKISPPLTTASDELMGKSLIERLYRTQPTTDVVYAEYKPKRPTKTYINQWCHAICEFNELIDGVINDIVRSYHFYIYIGGFYSKPESLYWDNGEVVEGEHDWLTEDQKQICLETRFDLEHSNA